MDSGPSTRTRALRSRPSRTGPPNPTNDLPFPEGLPNPQRPLEVLLLQLNQGTFSCNCMSRVDDLMVRILFESKYQKRPRDSENAKFRPLTPIPNALALQFCRKWSITGSTVGLPGWPDAVAQIWDEVVVPELPRLAGTLQREDKAFFTKSVMRYSLIYRPDSPVKLISVTFPGMDIPQRGVQAKVPIPAGTFILELGGWGSSDPVGPDVARFSVMTTGKKQGRRYNALLAGSIRFLNHRCQPNCEYRTLIDPETTEALYSFAVTARRDIAAGEELTVDYGRDYFQGDQKCLCPDCVPRTEATVTSRVSDMPAVPKKKKEMTAHQRKKLRRLPRQIRADGDSR